MAITTTTIGTAILAHAGNEPAELAGSPKLLGAAGSTRADESSATGRCGAAVSRLGSPGVAAELVLIRLACSRGAEVLCSARARRGRGRDRSADVQALPQLLQHAVVFRSEVEMLKTPHPKWNVAIAIKNRNQRFLLVQREADLIHHVVGFHRRRRQDNEHTRRTFQRALHRTVPQLPRVDVQLIDPHRSSRGPQIRGKTQRKFGILSAVTEKGDWRVWQRTPPGHDLGTTY